MTKAPTDLKAILLAGLAIPAMVLTPVSATFAQTPDNAHPGQREGGPRGGGAGGGMREGSPHGGPREGGAGGGMRGERGPHAEGGGGGQGTAGERHAPAAERAPAQDHAGPGRAERAAPAAPAAEGGPGERHNNRRNAERNNAPGAAEPSGAPDEGRREMRRQNHEERAQQRHERRDEDREGQAQQRGPRDDNGMRNGPAANAPAEHGPGERRMGNRPDERGPGERRLGNEGRPGDREPGERGGGERRFGNGPGREMSPAGAAAIGAAAGFAGGFIAATGARRLDEIRRDRREVREGDRTFIREPGRTIVEEGDRRFVVHDYNDRFRELGYRVNRERRGGDFVDTVVVPGGDTVLTFTNADGRLLRRVRRGRDGREVILFENDVRPLREDVVVLPPPPLRIPRDRYIVDYAAADAGAIYDTLVAPPVAPPPRRYTLDQVLYSPDVRSYVRSIDINTINFDTGSWIVPGDQTDKLVGLGKAINRAIDRDPNSVFLIEGYTDATGNPTDNLSLSDRRAQSVAAILTKSFNVPPENLTTQGYGDQNLKENTSGPSAANRRVVVRNITQLLAAGGAPPQ